MHLDSVETSHSVRLHAQQETVLPGVVQGTEFQDKGAAYGRQARSEDTLPDEGQQKKIRKAYETKTRREPVCVRDMGCLKLSQRFTPEPVV